MRPDGPVIMLCTRVKDGTPPVISVEEKCHFCGTGVWVSMASLDLAENNKAAYACPPCCMKHMEEHFDRDGSISVMPPALTQMVEILKAKGKI